MYGKHLERLRGIQKAVSRIAYSIADVAVSSGFSSLSSRLRQVLGLFRNVELVFFLRMMNIESLLGDK